jgi:hypothetical protein
MYRVFIKQQRVGCEDINRELIEGIDYIMYGSMPVLSSRQMKPMHYNASHYYRLHKPDHDDIMMIVNVTRVNIFQYYVCGDQMTNGRGWYGVDAYNIEDSDFDNLEDINRLADTFKG